MDIRCQENKKYINYNFKTDGDSILRNYVGDYYVPEEVISRLIKSLGISYSLYCNIREIEGIDLLKTLSTQSKIEDITLLVDTEEKKVIDYSFEAPRTPILNSDFINRTCSMIESATELDIREWYYHKDDTLSSILVKRVDGYDFVEKHLNSDDVLVHYDIGVVIINDELNNTYCRFVIYVDGGPIYLPANYYSSTTSRFKRSTSNSSEALELLVLKVIDDLRNDEFIQEKLSEIHPRYKINKDIVASYEEYNTLIKTMLKIPTVLDDRDIMNSLNNRYDNFEKKYAHLEDQKSSYIWRCTATSETTIGALVSLTVDILTSLSASPIEYLNIRELLGAYISTTRIVKEIAKES